MLLWTAPVPAMSCGQDTSPPSPKPARDVVGGGGDDDRILNLLRQVVDKTRYTTNLVGKTAEVSVTPSSWRQLADPNVLEQCRPCANIAWRIIESA